MAKLATKTVSFIVGAPTGEKIVELVADSLYWLDQPPFMAPETPRWEVTLRNLWSEPTKVSIGMWAATHHTEGGWCVFDMDGLSEQTFTCSSTIPAEPIEGNITLHLSEFGRMNYLPGLYMKTVQNPDALVPEQSPPEYDDWVEPKEFPIPYTLSGIQFELIRLPMLSKSSDTQGEITVYLLSPKDSFDWGRAVGEFEPTQARLMLSELIGAGGDYTYEFIFNHDYKWPSLCWSTKILTQDDDSGVYTIPFTFPKTDEPLGSHLPINILVRLEVASRPGRTFYLLWSPEVERLHLYCVLGYINVGT